MTDIDKDDCKDYRDAINKRIDEIWKKIDCIESRLNWFYILAIASLATFILNIVQGRL